MKEDNFVVRDFRNGDWFWMNKYIWEDSELNASDKLVYSVLTYFANQQEQNCFPSYSSIIDKTQLSEQTIRKSIKLLESKKIIKVEREPGKVSTYFLLKLTPYKINAGIETPPTPPVKEMPHPLSKKCTNNNNITNSYTTYNAKPIEIVFLLAEYKKVGLTDKEQKASFVARHIRAAKLLTPYPKERIQEVMSFLDKQNFKWTLETVGKYIDEDLNKQEENNMLQKGFWKCNSGYWHKKGEECGHYLLKK